MIEKPLNEIEKKQPEKYQKIIRIAEAKRERFQATVTNCVKTERFIKDRKGIY